MDLYFGGAEVPGWRKLLAEERVPHVSMSFVGLSNRIKRLDEWDLADRFPADPGFRQEVFLDSGAYSLNKEGSKYTDAEAIGLAAAYFTFVVRNIARIDVFSEFDALLIDPQSREDARQALHELAPDKFMPIWHSEYGLDELERLAENFDRVGVLQPDEDEGDDLTSVLRRLSGKTRLHGIAMTRMGAMRSQPWDSVGSTSWLAPGQWGETHIWAHNELTRYPVKYKASSRKRHRVAIADAGFDPVAIARDATDERTPDDRKEVLRLSLWSWSQFVDHINNRKLNHVIADRLEHLVTEPGDADDGDFAETSGASVGKPRGQARNGELVVKRREKTLLPVLSVTQGRVNESGDGGATEPLPGLSGTNLMRCNSCVAKDKCHAFEPDSECAFDIPMEITTTTQARALRKLLLSMQGQRVVTMRMFEQFEGGYADPNLSAEIGRLQKMLNDDLAADRDRASLHVEITSDGNAGFISRMFGGETEQKVNALAMPLDPGRILESTGIFDAELVENEGTA